MQNFSDVKYCNAKETFSNLWLNERAVGKMCVFQRKTVRISEAVRDTAKVTINH